MVGGVAEVVPWLATLAAELGFSVRLLESSRSSLAEGEHLCNSFDSCGPVKIAHAVCHSDAELLLFPKVLGVGDPQGKGGPACLTEQAMPEMMERMLRTHGREAEVVRPGLDFSNGYHHPSLFEELRTTALGASRRALKKALGAAARAQQEFEHELLAIGDRARLYSSYLALLNDRNELENSLFDARRRLKMVLGPNASLESLSSLVVIAMPSQLEIESLLRSALEKRADYRLLAAEVRAMQLAEEAARTEDGFRLKYIQPAYNVGYDGGDTGWELSASLVLPWGTRNPDIAVYQSQQVLSMAAQAEQRKIIEDRLRVLLDTAEAHYTQISEQNRRIQPVISRLNADIETLVAFPLEQIRDVLSIRERILDASLQSAESKCRAETLAVDLAEELGGWQ